MQELNPQQREAITYAAGPLLVLAGAGSGKTRVITEKIAHLINHCQLSPRHITAVTFTNKAAKEMQQRVGNLLDAKAKRGLRISTFHTLGLTILKKHSEAVGLKANFSIFDAEDSLGLLRELIPSEQRLDKDYYRGLQSRISQWKNDLLSPIQAQQQAEDEETLKTAQLYEHYQRHLQAYNAVDFDDLIFLPTRLLQSNSDIRERWQHSIHYLLVDEYQDTSENQYTLIKLLTGIRQKLMVVGDDDQSIYAWRGANPENIHALQRDFPTLKVVKLEQNYRSFGNILRAANHVIQNNPRLFHKNLWSNLGTGDKLGVLYCRSEEHEAEQVVAQLIAHRIQQGTQQGDYAILYRSNHQSRPLEKVLRHHSIPYHITGGQSFFARTEIKDILAYLRLVTNPTDDAAFLRIINVPRRGIGATTLEKLGHYAKTRQVSLFQACSDLGLGEHLSGAGLKALRLFQQWIEQLQRDCQSPAPMEPLRQMLKEMDYFNWLDETSSKPSVAEKRIENVQDFYKWIQKLIEKEDEDKAQDMLGTVVNKIILLDRLEQQNESPDCVQLMTIHAAKGLEFPHVFVLGMEEKILPHKNSLEAETLEEERRLAYVAITRAKRSLTFSLAAKRLQQGEMMATEPSRFLLEIPDEDLQWQGHPRKKKDPEESLAQGKNHLSALKAMLGR